MVIIGDTLNTFKVKTIFQSMEFAEDAEIHQCFLIVSNYICSKKFCGLSWDKQFSAFIVALCQLEFSNGSFAVPQFHGFFSLTKIVLS